MNPAAVAVVGSDHVAVAAAEKLGGGGVDVLQVRSDEVADLHVSLHADGFEVEGQRIEAVLLREPIGAVAPTTFAAEDWGFVLAEVAATWLAATQLGSVLTINHLDAEAWFEGGQWPVWRRRLRTASVELSPLRVGNVPSGSYWRPYIGHADRPAPSPAVRKALGTALTHTRVAETTLFACGEPIGGEPPPEAARAAKLLQESGVQLTSISYDGDGRVVGVDPFPSVAADHLEAVAGRLASAIHDHLRRR